MLITFAGTMTVPTLASSSMTRPSVPLPVAASPSPASLANEEVTTLAKPEPAAATLTPAIDDASVECIAKVVRHEAANQSERGQLAVAQLIVTRTTVGTRFGRTPCAVVDQPGQFFETEEYHPDRNNPQWDRAVAAARDALAHVSPPVVPGALFYHSAVSSPPRFFRGRARVAVLGDHIFYR